ncbi:MAG: (2Fe-2S)-binding protein [Hyphomicrobiales bacterium]|nr:(2Fe-2S)-binding protein [Hyphomicrobiales bacterium]
MIICACNRLSDTAVRNHCETAAGNARVKNVYPALGGQACCGRCARTIREIVRETNAAALAGAKAEMRAAA